jgi:hypothetical protein
MAVTVAPARRRRTPLGSAAFAGAAAALYVTAGIAATWPAVRDLRSAFLARADPSYGEAASGDHLQLGYALWLVGHQLGRLAAPLRDPYSFQPVVEPVPNLQGWLFGLPYWPLERLFGTVGAWNVFTLGSYALAGGAACWWLRSLGLRRGPALVGGLAFALAPYRVAQSTGHLLGPISALLPLMLVGLERGRDGSRRWLALAVAALVALPLSGQLHLALGAVPLALAYALVRGRTRAPLVAAAAGSGLAAAAGLVVERAVLADSVAGGGRSRAEVAAFSADWSGFVTRDVGPLEEFVLLGWVTPLLAVAGLAVLVAGRSSALAVLLAVMAVVPALLALGTNLPLYEPLWDALPPFRYPRVPERLLPIACLALAALAAIAIDRIDWRWAAPLALLVVAVDLRAGVSLYRPARADQANPAYAVLAEGGPGRLLELPVFLPERQYGSVYQYYLQQAPRERPGGYSTVAPQEADSVARSLVPLNCGAWSPGLARRLDELGIRFVAVHRGLYADPAVPDCAARAIRRLRQAGFVRVTREADITLFARQRETAR